MRGRLPADAMYPAGVDSVRVRRITLRSGLTLRLAESGDAASRVVVLLHGWGASLYMWRAWFEPLAAAGYRAVAIDLPGHGLSDKPVTRGAYTLARQLEVMRELFDVEQLEGAHLVAQSMAGTIALELALAEPSIVSRLALVNPAIFGRIRLQPLARLVTPPLLDPLLGRWVPRWMVARAHRLAYADASRITARDVDEYWAPSQFPTYAPAMRQLLHEFRWSRPPAESLATRLGALPRAPLVVLSGRDQLVRDTRSYASTLQRLGAALDVFDVAQGGHAVNEEEPALVLDRVLEHLR